MKIAVFRHKRIPRLGRVEFNAEGDNKGGLYLLLDADLRSSNAADGRA
jgi:hypothetical protein